MTFTDEEKPWKGYRHDAGARSGTGLSFSKRRGKALTGKKFGQR